MVDQPNRCQTWLPTLLKIENLTTNHHVKIVNVYKKLFFSETTVLTRSIKMRQWWYSCLFDVYMNCCSLSVTGPQTSTSQEILIKRYSKNYRHNVKSISDIKIHVCSKYPRKIYSVSVTVLLHTE